MLLDSTVTSNLILRNISPDEVTENYVSWLNNPSINRFLEVRNSLVTLRTQKNFVEEVNSSKDSCLFGIFTLDNTLIGTTKIGPINFTHRTASLGILIGASEYHGLGFGSSAINTACNLFQENGLLRKINAGVMSANIASVRAFEKSGFSREGCRISQLIDLKGEFADEILFGKLLHG
jgi:ribosomal-protein-alanine N-acetyltransferase